MLCKEEVMSRTYKDRPYWVKVMDERYDRYIAHDHWVRNVYGYIYVPISLEEYEEKALYPSWKWKHPLYFDGMEYYYRARVIQETYEPECVIGYNSPYSNNQFIRCYYKLAHYEYDFYNQHNSRQNNRYRQERTNERFRNRFATEKKNYVKAANGDRDSIWDIDIEGYNINNDRL